MSDAERDHLLSVMDAELELLQAERDEAGRLYKAAETVANPNEYTLERAMDAWTLAIGRVEGANRLFEAIRKDRLR
jgi:hypothetical protein